MTAAAIYARVSTDEQTTEQQLVELREAAGRLRLDVAVEVDETGSGAKADRPGLLRVMEAARRGEVRAVLVWKLDRLGRSLTDLARNVDELRSRGVRLVAITQGIDLDPARDDPAARFAAQVLGAAAEYERALIVERTKLGHRRVRKEKRDRSGPPKSRDRNAPGWPIGRPPASPVLLHAAADLVRNGDGLGHLVSIRAAAAAKGVSEATLRRFLRANRAEGGPEGVPGP